MITPLSLEWASRYLKGVLTMLDDIQCEGCGVTLAAEEAECAERDNEFCGDCQETSRAYREFLLDQATAQRKEASNGS